MTPTDNDVALALLPVSQAFEQLGVPYYVGGSVASSVIGEPRATMDVDVVANIEPHHVAPFIEVLGNQYYADDRAILDAIRHRASFNLIHFGTFVKIDVFLSNTRPYDLMAMSRHRARKIGRNADAPIVEVAAAEDVVLAKLEWYRAGGGVSERQWRDILGVIKMQREALDFEYLRHWADELEVDDLLQRAYEDAGIEYDGVE